jgi:hypothetical protein
MSAAASVWGKRHSLGPAVRGRRVTFANHLIAAAAEALALPVLPDEPVWRIQRERAAGRSFRAIADGPTSDRFPTGQRARRSWLSTVRSPAERGRAQRRESG